MEVQFARESCIVRHVLVLGFQHWRLKGYCMLFAIDLVEGVYWKLEKPDAIFDFWEWGGGKNDTIQDVLIYEVSCCCRMRTEINMGPVDGDLTVFCSCKLANAVGAVLDRTLHLP